MSKQGTPRHRRPWGVAVFTILAVGIGAVLVWGYFAGKGEAALEAKREAPVKPAIQVSTNESGTPTIVLGPQLQKRADIEVRLPQVTPYRQRLRAYGSILDLQAFTDLSNRIATAKALLATAEAKLAASKAAYERAQVLVKGQNISTAQLQSAEATYRSDEASVEGAKVQAKNATASALQAWGPVLGQSLSAGTALATDLVQHKKVLVQVTLPLGVSLEHPPPEASIEATTGRQVRIDFVSAATRTDPKIQGVSFFYTAEAASGALPGMNVIAYLPVGESRPSASVPASAVVWLDGKAWLYVETAPHRYSRRQIPTDEPAAGGGYIVPVSGASKLAELDPLEPNTAAHELRKDQPIVVKGAQFLLSQEFSAQIQVGGD